MVFYGKYSSCHVDTSQIDFLGHVFGANIKNNVGVYFQNSTKLSPPEMIPALKKVLHENVPVSQLNQK